MKDTDIAALAREFQIAGLTELYVKTADFELFLGGDATATVAAPGQARAARRAPASLPPAAPPSIAGPSAHAAPTLAPLPDGLVVVRAPYLCTFYRAPKPGEPNFVEIGDTVQPETDLCLVEVMKLFTAVRADSGGVVRQILAVDGQMVEEGQALFALEPAG